MLSLPGPAILSPRIRDFVKVQATTSESCKKPARHARSGGHHEKWHGKPFQPWIGPEGVICKAIKAAFMASPVMRLT